MFPTSVWVIIQKDRKGKPRGFEKVLEERFYLNEMDAHVRFKNLNPLLQSSFSVEEAVIMSPAEFQASLTSAALSAEHHPDVF